MAFADKRGVLNRVAAGDRVAIELGCGPFKKNADAVGIDLLDYEGVDLVGDAVEILRAFPAESVDRVFTSHFLEHVEELPSLLAEIERVLRVGGIFEAVVPHFANPYFSSDPTHSRRFGLYTFSYLSEERLFRRRVPTYQRDLRLRLADVELTFKSTRPFYVRHAFKKAVGMVVNSCRYFQELHEELFCYICPAYEVRYELEKMR